MGGIQRLAASANGEFVGGGSGGGPRQRRSPAAPTWPPRRRRLGRRGGRARRHPSAGKRGRRQSGCPCAPRPGRPRRPSRGRRSRCCRCYHRCRWWATASPSPSPLLRDSRRGCRRGGRELYFRPSARPGRSQQDKCFVKCITKPSSSLTEGESTCLAKCRTASSRLAPLWSRRWKPNSEERGGWVCRHLNRRLENNPLFYLKKKKKKITKAVRSHVGTPTFSSTVWPNRAEQFPQL